MSQAKIKLFLVEQDAIFRLGLRTALTNYTDFEIIGEGNLSSSTLRELTQGLILNVLLIGINYGDDGAIPGLEFTQQLRELYPQLPLFLLTPSFSAKQLTQLQRWGVTGNCDRSASINTIVEGIKTVAYGNNYWISSVRPPRLWQRTLARFSRTGRLELAATLAEIEQQLSSPNLSDWERVFLIGRKRELLTARWFSQRLLTEQLEPEAQQQTAELVPLPELAPLPVFVDSNNKEIFERVATDIQIGLNNRSQLPLEIDVLRQPIRKGLCHLILKQLSDTIKQIPIAQTLDQDYSDYLQALWSWSLTTFFTQHYGQLTPEEETQLAMLMEQEFSEVKLNILSYVYGTSQLIEYLLGQPNLEIDNVNYAADAPEAITRIEFLLHNLILHLASGVMQVLLNNFSDLEVFKYQLYQAEYRSDRQLARFRNQLSWKYRQENYLTQPQDIFESRHRLLIIDRGTIRTTYVYAPRKAELEKLSGIPWLATIIIEARDALAPLVRKIIALAGSGLVFVLTQVVGRGLGLIGKGIIQGIGNTVKDVPRSKKRP